MILFVENKKLAREPIEEEEDMWSLKMNYNKAKYMCIGRDEKKHQSGLYIVRFKYLNAEVKIKLNILEY